MLEVPSSVARPARRSRARRVISSSPAAAAATSEPFGEAGVARPRLFCVQEHDARRRHFDLRLEIDGVLRSWAVPQGFSADPAVKRLAVATEDHPVEYADFEGVIPKGQYGGGTVMLWDEGMWQAIGDAHRAYAKGKLDFELKGKRLKGRWHLVRMRGRAGNGKRENWLLRKLADEHARPQRQRHPARRQRHRRPPRRRRPGRRRSPRRRTGAGARRSPAARRLSWPTAPTPAARRTAPARPARPARPAPRRRGPARGSRARWCR